MAKAELGFKQSISFEVNKAYNFKTPMFDEACYNEVKYAVVESI